MKSLATAAVMGAVLLNAVTAFAAPRKGQPAPAFVGQPVDRAADGGAAGRGGFLLAQLKTARQQTQSALPAATESEAGNVSFRPSSRRLSAGP